MTSLSQCQLSESGVCLTITLLININEEREEKLSLILHPTSAWIYRKSPTHYHTIQHQQPSTVTMIYFVSQEEAMVY